MITQVVVGLSDIQVIQGGGALSVEGIGSGVGIVAFDPVAKVGGAANVLLPNSKGQQVDQPGRYADTACKELLEMMGRLGADPTRVVAVVVGAAALFSGDQESVVNFGKRTATTVRQVLEAQGATIVKDQIGGQAGRVLSLDLGTGNVTVQTANSVAQTLCSLKEAA
ncbi:MAG TPA: hypothetical protein PKA27_12970 [Fimbriimonadaceae bacterium]|nr:hypothetical protein [Fimbriimonadaceae bacterium]